jgi:hypothetical protein
VPAQKEGERRPSPVRMISEEDRLQALRVRQNALKDGGACSARVHRASFRILTPPAELDLAAIARSSAAVSGSPPRSAGAFPTTDVSLFSLSLSQCMCADVVRQ